MKEKWRLKNRMKSFGYAIKGLKALFTEPNLVIHLCAAILAIIAGLILKISATHWAIITLIIALVISLELINTALEKLIDHLHPNQHPIIGKVKDIAAGAVLIAALGAIIIAGLIFGSYLFCN